MRFGTSKDATGRQQLLGLMVETVVECGRCELALTATRRIWRSVVVTGRGPAAVEIGTTSWQSSDRGHDVSILIAIIAPVGR